MMISILYLPKSIVYIFDLPAVRDKLCHKREQENAIGFN
jgi:hypothetical protein